MGKRREVLHPCDHMASGSAAAAAQRRAISISRGVKWRVQRRVVEGNGSAKGHFRANAGVPLDNPRLPRLREWAWPMASTSPGSPGSVGGICGRPGAIVKVMRIFSAARNLLAGRCGLQIRCLRHLIALGMPARSAGWPAPWTLQGTPQVGSSQPASDRADSPADETWAAWDAAWDAPWTAPGLRLYRDGLWNCGSSGLTALAPWRADHSLTRSSERGALTKIPM
jgi:hypothetical protein